MSLISIAILSRWLGMVVIFMIFNEAGKQKLSAENC